MLGALNPLLPSDVMMQIHPPARTTPAVRAEIARSTKPVRILAKHYGISEETVRKWRKRGEQACQDRSSRPKRLPSRVTEEERAIICAVRGATGFPLNDLTFVLRHFLPHLECRKSTQSCSIPMMSHNQTAPQLALEGGRCVFVMITRRCLLIAVLRRLSLHYRRGCSLFAAVA